MMSSQPARKLDPPPAPPPKRPHAPAKPRVGPKVAVPPPPEGFLDRHGGKIVLAMILLSLGVHVAMRAGITRLPERPAGVRKQVEKVEFNVVEKPKPPPPEPPKPEPKKPEPKKVVKLDKPPPKPPPQQNLPPPPPDVPPPPPDAPPPPPNAEAPAKTEPPPVLIAGMNNLSFTNGPSNMTVSRGNTMYGAPSNVGARPEDVKPYKAEKYAPAYQLTEAPSCEPIPDEALRGSYPDEAKRAEIEAQVRLKIIVDSDGTIASAAVVKKYGYGLDDNAAKLVRKFLKCRPGKQNGEPVATEINYTVTYELDF